MSTQQRHFCIHSFSIFQSKDEKFIEYEKRFLDLESSVKNFLTSTQKFSDQLHDLVICQFNVAQYFQHVFNQQTQTREVERFNNAHKKIVSDFWSEFVSIYLVIQSRLCKCVCSQTKKLGKRVVNPLRGLSEMFQGPSRLVQKRNDKQLDFSAIQQKAEKNRDPSKSKAVSR